MVAAVTTNTIHTPHLFGLKNSNRDFRQPEAWGKNQFNSSFPAALCCYMDSMNLPPVYLCLKNGVYQQDYISIKDLFKINPLSETIYFSFETPDLTFQPFLIGPIPRTDLVIQDISGDSCKINSFFEIKLTALPDNTTCHFDDESSYGCELVIRPDTIVYQAVSIAKSNTILLHSLLSENRFNLKDWSDPNEIIPYLPKIKKLLKDFISNSSVKQTPLIIQPIWKTKGKSPTLAEDCLDVFVWSDIAFLYFLLDITDDKAVKGIITRQTRSMVWLFKMLYEITLLGKVDHKKIIDSLTYNTKNDKAFASSGSVTNGYMRCTELSHPRIKKSEIKHIILGGGQNLLSPERRFDAIIYNSPELF